MSRLRLAVGLAALALLWGSCVSSGQIRTSAGVVEQNLKLARKQGAMKCAPRELATGEAHLTFTFGELEQGNWVRAKDHVQLAEDAAKKAVVLSKGCVKKILIKAPERPPVIVKIEEKDTDGDGLLDNVDDCPEDPEDFDGFEDDDGCPDLDNDKDGVPDTEDRCPVVPGPVENQGCPLDAPMDSDGDGIPDDIDKCPTDPEDKDGWEDSDGCPDPDNDKDGLLDGDDKCPNQPGPLDNQGCPVNDRDGDGIPDHQDKCPDEPEDKDGYEDDDGCPDLDNDSDGIPDVADKCPMEPGIPELEGCPAGDRDGDTVLDHVDDCPTVPGPVENKGCPKYELVVMHDDRIEIKQKVFFQTAKWRILPRSYELLNQVAGILKDREDIHIRIEGHTDSKGKDRYNLRLSTNRGNSVREYLMGQGVSGSRMESVGFGETRPIASNATRIGREQNRRVEFFITEQ